MRDYLYLWNDPDARRLVTSGLQFRDLVPTLSTGGGVYLLRHQWPGDEVDGLTFAPTADLPALLAENLYSWGDLAWADYAAPSPPTLAPEAIAELLYFGHAATPLRDVAIPGLDNCCLGFGHDDGWSLTLRYTAWRHVEDLLASLVAAPTWTTIAADLLGGTGAFWIANDTVEPEERSTNLDAILNRRLSGS